MAAIHLYAEHLVNIRMLSIQASLQTTSNQETRSTLSADGKTLSLEHEGETAKVQFPAELLSGKNRATFVIPAAPTKDLTLRLRIDEKPGTTSVLGGDVVDNEIITPWTAASLTKGVEITCRSCCAVFVDRSTITQWKDLPSEGWAEMMEFWHCHKPDVPHETHDHGDIKKGYSADSHLVHDSGTCLVNPMEFWLAAKDCQNIEVGRAPLFSSHLHSPWTKKNRYCQAFSGYLRDSVGIQMSNIEWYAAESSANLAHAMGGLQMPEANVFISLPCLRAHGLGTIWM